MKAIFIETDDSSNLRLLLKLANKLKVKTKILKNEELEDIALANALIQGEKGEYLTDIELITNLKK
jgi:hypothetical protein